MEFEHLNETGSIHAADNGSFFHFQYANDFYGSGTFAAQVIELRNRTLELDPEFKWRDYHLRRGSLEGLSKSARVFFSRELHRYRSLVELRGNLLKFEEPAGGRTAILNLLRWRSIA